MARRALVAAFLVALALLPAGTASAADVGVRFGYYTKVEQPFVGVEFLTRVAHRVYFNPNFEWVFTDGFDYYTVNGDFHYDFPMRGHTYVWLGAGLALGASGAVIAVGNVAPRHCYEIAGLVAQQKLDLAREKNSLLDPLTDAVTRRHGIGGLKAAVDLIGLHGGAPRPPLRPIGAAARDEIAGLLAGLGLPS